MMIESVTQYFAERGFTSMRGNEEGFLVNYIYSNQEAYVLIHFFMPSGDEFTTGKVWQIHQHITSHFFLQGTSQVHVLHIFYTRHPELLHHLCPEGESFWLVDMNINRLILFEDQPSDFIGIRQGLEDFILAGFTRQRNYGMNTLAGSKKGIQTGICNVILVAVNVLIFVVFSLLAADTQNIILQYGALYWPAVFNDHEYYRLITHMFLHGGTDHLLSNMVALFFIGNQVELLLGKRKYLVLYFISGILAGTVSIIYNMINSTDTSSIGASGAIFGIFGAMLGILVINKGRIKDFSARRLGLYIILSIYSGMTSQGIDNAAHVGGLLAGLILAFILYRGSKRQHKERERENR